MHNSEKSAEKNSLFREEFFPEYARDEAIIQLKTVSGKLAADIGAGQGFISEGLLNAGLKVIAEESSPLAIDFLKNKFRGINEFETVLSDSAAIKLDNDSVDYAFASMYLHHTENPQEAIKEIFRILKPGGKAAITDILFHDHLRIIKNHNDRWPGFTLPDIYDWLINAGFKNISIEKLNKSFIYQDEKGDAIEFNIFIGCGEK